MAFIPFSGAYTGAEYDPSSGDVAFVNYGTNTSGPLLPANFPPSICLGFAGRLKFGSISRDFTSDQNSFHYINIEGGTSSSSLVIPKGSTLSTTEYEDSGGGDFTFTATDRLQFLCDEAIAGEALINVNVNTWAEITGDSAGYISVVAAAKGDTVPFNNPFSYGGGAANGIPSTSTTGFRLPARCEMTFAGIASTVSGRDGTLTSDLVIEFLVNGIFQGSITLLNGDLCAAFTGPVIPVAQGATVTLQASSSNTGVISAVVSMAFKIT